MPWIKHERLLVSFASFLLRFLAERDPRSLNEVLKLLVHKPRGHLRIVTPVYAERGDSAQ